MALSDTVMPVLIGKLVGLMTAIDRQAALHHAWPMLLGMLAFMLVLRPMVLLFDRLLRFNAVMPGMTSLVRWQNHWHVVRQSWPFFQDDFAGRIANRVMQTGNALRESAVSGVRAVWYIVIYGHLAGAPVHHGQHPLRQTASPASRMSSRPRVRHRPTTLRPACATAKAGGGFDAHVGERGVNLSGGQRQRNAIARVILKDARTLILDEATSALDSEVDLAIQEQLLGLMDGNTVIAIAHHLSTIARLDRLIILDEGRIVEAGPHQELLGLGGHYSELWRYQSGGFYPAIFPAPTPESTERLQNYCRTGLIRQPSMIAPG